MAKQSSPRAKAAGKAPSPAPLWPEEGLRWQSAWSADLPIVRGIHVPPLGAAPEFHAKDFLLPNRVGNSVPLRLEAMAQATGHAWTYWGQTAPYQVPWEAFCRKELEHWLELVAQISSYRFWSREMGLLLRWCIAEHDLAFALNVGLRGWEMMARAQARLGQSSGRNDLFVFLAPLRQAIAASAPEDYAPLLHTAQNAREAGREQRMACAYLFPHLGEWAAEFCGTTLEDWEAGLLWHAAVPAERFVQLLRTSNADHGDRFDWRAALLLQLHLHGAAALEALGLVLAGAVQKKGASAQGVELLKLIAQVRVPAMPSLLASHLNDKKVREAVEKLAREFPVATLQCCIAQAFATPGDEARAQQSWVLGLASKHPKAQAAALAAVAEQAPAARDRFAAAQARLNPVEVPAERLPALLRTPPWLSGPPQALPAFEVATLPTPERLVLDADQQQRAQKPRDPSWGRYRDEHGFPNCFGLTTEGANALKQGQPLPAEGGVRAWQGASAHLFTLPLCPPQAQLPLWNSYPTKMWSRWMEDSDLWHVFMQHGFAAMPGLVNYLRANPDISARVAITFDSPGLVPWQLHQMHHGKQHRAAAARWVRTYARTVLFWALPQAFSPTAGPQRDTARQTIRWLAEQGETAWIDEAAQAYGGAMPQAAAQLLALDPLTLLPATLPKRPAFIELAALARPVLADGSGALPLSAVEHLLTMLMISAPDAAYPGIALVKAACTAESLAEFAWDVCEAWLAAGASLKEIWALHALGHLGTDSTARRLAPRIREWQENSAPSRAMAGLDLLTAIGSDVALLYLNKFARQNKFKALRQRALALIDNLAEARGLSADELADRLVPTLGLDEQAAMEIDFGPRRFRLRFDEALHPYLTDAQGQRLKQIPRPNKNDDAALAKAASDRYKVVRKEVEAIATQQLARLERAMATQRRWSAADFRLFFLDHPLMRHLAMRLIWGIYDGEHGEGALRQAFRIAEDWSLADGEDNTCTLADDAQVGIAHVLELSADAATAFAQVLSDYELIQPFKQLGRETFALDATEQAASELSRFKDRKVPSVSVLSLNHRGWATYGAGDYSASSYYRDLPGSRRLVLRFEPGLVFGDPQENPVQTLGELTLVSIDPQRMNKSLPFGALPSIMASEALRDLELLAQARSQ